MGCGNDQPKPKASSDINIIPMHTINLEEIESVETMIYESGDQEFYVKHHVRGKDVYVECYIPSFSFQKSNLSGEGYIHLYVDNKKVDKITTAAFIVRGLSTGSHNIKLDIINPNLNQNHLSKQFQVNIQWFADSPIKEINDKIKMEV